MPTRDTPSSAHHATAVHVCPGGDFGVLHTADGHSLVVLRAFLAGTKLLTLDGPCGPERSRYSLQIGARLHLSPFPQHVVAGDLDHGFWRFINHSCEPSACLHGQDVVSARALAAGEAVTYNYATTEWDLAEPFHCRCGSARCLGWVAGYRHLTPEQRSRIGAVAPHLLALAS